MKIARIIFWPQDSTLPPTMKREYYINSDATGFDIKLTPSEIPDLFKKSGI